MNILPRPVATRVRPSENGSQTLFDYIQAIEPDPLPGPRQVCILEVLNSVYDDPQEEIEKPVVEIIAADAPLQKTETESTESNAAIAIKTRRTSTGFALASISVITSVVGWLTLLLLPDEAGISVMIFSQFLALCIAMASFTCPNEESGTRPLGLLALMTTVGWIPIAVFLIQGGPMLEDFFPLIMVAFVLYVILFVWMKTREEEPKYEFKLDS